MTTQDPLPLRHLHYFLSAQHERNEQRVWMVIALTATMMFGEIVAGIVFGSMALLADGWHMFTHAGALTISALAYGYARKHVDDPRFSFGTGKVGELVGFTSAVILAIIAVAIAYESIIRLFRPIPIAFDQALMVAALGLVVNFASVWLLREGGHSHAGHEHAAHGHDGGHHHHGHTHGEPAPSGHDTNLRSAYAHVMADAATSALAIAGLLAGRFQGWIWMDALVGIVGALVIARWSYGLIRQAGAVLLDTVPDHLLGKVRAAMEEHGGSIADLHIWQVGPGHHAVILSLEAHARPTSFYKRVVGAIPGVSHVTVEGRR